MTDCRSWTMNVTFWCLLAIATSACAECASVLWTQDHPPSGHLDEKKWRVLNAYASEQVCRSVETVLTRNAPTGIVYHYLCLPDTVDPRGMRA
jgi:hypothetical protein